MSQTVVPMIHVPDVQTAVDWYRSIGFELVRENRDDGELNWAKMSFGNSDVMFSAGGRSSDAPRREMDLYIAASKIDEIFQRLKNQAQIVEEPHGTFYGMREFIIRDCNGFWITFGEPAKT